MSVAEDCGIRVNPHRRKSDVVVGIVDAIRSYLIDPERVVRDGKRGWKRLKTEYSWKAKREKMIASYKRLAGDCESDES
jgi:glycosyltransferase involved in cell wall biosynthesis